MSFPIAQEALNANLNTMNLSWHHLHSNLQVVFGSLYNVAYYVLNFHKVKQHYVELHNNKNSKCNIFI